MLIRNELYYAPNVKFAELDMSGNALPDQFDRRIRGYYLEPAVQAAHSGHGFAAGVLLVACIDALADIQTDNNKVGERFRQWCSDHLSSFSDYEISQRFYENFRNGLVHNARIKNAGEFTLESAHTVEVKEQILSINPLHLAEEISNALIDYVERLKADPKEKGRLLGRVRLDFEYELNN